MTFSIAGRCARTGMLGAVVTTSAMAVGSRCAFAEAGIGAALTQHRTDPRLGPIMLDGLKRGEAPEAVLRALEQSDPDLGWRQLAAIAADGRAAFFNGSRITSIAKGRVGRDCVAIGNILRTPDVVDAMVESFEASEAEPLAERLVRAIEAGQAAGGELRQVKSAGLLVVHRERFPYVDLRVDLSAQPLVELRFLWELYRPEVDAYVVRAVDPDQAATPA
ncbi:MAG: DUF1028 domain-containing protein [Reyranella sp.]|uniref:DUF1028 domain-containing protein n=1 Tax=Reyranella sp. TaxID=1929291 RepID=UPI001AD51B67|nr:DUF1028 domain-containing protein [Reyranella sp.]MBN9091506.1 DUF1028 domain-containing protein [Reyranella sp.]